MKVLLIGANGQLGWELSRTSPSDVDLAGVDYPDVDFSSRDSIRQCVETAAPDCIINAAAYTNVDGAESDAAAAFRINHRAVGDLAEAAREKGALLVHISTDYVFSGRHYKPYGADDAKAPESVYGRSKLAGEQAVAGILGDGALIFRTAWLYSAHGANFVKTMLRLMAEKDSLTVIDEQVGTPTWANGLARAVWLALGKGLTGVFHWTDAGVASWYDFAVAIQEEALSAGLLTRAVPVKPVPASQYPTPAKRPWYGVLDKHPSWERLGVTPVHWRVQLRKMLKEMTE